MLGRESGFLQFQNNYQQGNHEDDTWKWILMISLFYMIPLSLLMLLCLDCCRSPQEHAPNINQQDNDIANREGPIDIIENEIADSTIIENRLIKAGMSLHEMREHPTLGFFYDFITAGLPDNPVIINTGQIVGENTAKQLVRNKSLLPQGVVSQFFHSTPLKNLYNHLVDSEINERSKPKK